jgi:hypothetical protein
VLKEIVTDFAVGVGFQYDYYHNINLQEINEIPVLPIPIPQISDKHSFGSTLEFVYDTRRNTINPLQGAYVRAVCRYNYAADSIPHWMSLYIDARKYIPLRADRHRLIALWALYWTVWSGTPFYLDLPSNGWDYYNRTARGILRNRYRSNSLIYLEAEYRSEITANGLWGMVLFANLTAPSTFQTYQYPTWYGAVGTGIRFKYNKFTGSNVFFDFAISKTFFNWYFGLNEYF